MSKVQLEHINISVNDVFETAKMLEFLFDWKIRWQGEGQLGGYIIHICDEFQYIALWMPKKNENYEKIIFKKGQPLNHIGIVVEDLGEIEKKVREIGLKPFSFQEYPPGRRFYFFDDNGIEFEIISYK